MPALTGRIDAPSNSYAEVLRTPGAWKFYLAAAPARIGIAMTGLGIVWLVHGSTGSYAAAGVTAIIQPGGSTRDPELIRLANRAGMAMIFTSERHYRH